MNLYPVTSADGPDGFEEGDEVVIKAGNFEGETGTVVGYAASAGVYLIDPDNPNLMGHRFAVLPSMIELVDLDEWDDESDLPELPETPKHGMTSDGLAQYVGEFIDACTTRVQGVGDEQYSLGTHQKFEAMGLDELVRWAREEVQDLAVYAAMLDIRLGRVQQALKGHL